MNSPSSFNRPFKRSSAFWLGLLLATATLHAAANPVLRITPHAASLAVGGTVLVDVIADDVQDLYAYDFSLSFSPSAISLISIAEGAFLQSGGNSTVFVPGTIDNTVGSAAFTGASRVGPVPGVNGSGILATFAFLGIGTGVSFLNLTDSLLLDSQFNDFPVDLVNSQLQVGAATNIPEPSTLPLVIGALASLGFASSIGKSKRVD